MRLAYVIYTFDKIHDALIQMEIIRNIWEKRFGSIEIIHVYNGKEEWYPEKTLEDKLIRIDNPGHFEGASNLMDVGVERALEGENDYIVVSAADTWMLDDGLINSKINQMTHENRALFTCPWGNPEMNNPQDVGLATDFFIIDSKWERTNRIFPLRYAEFKEKYLDMLRYLGKGNVMVERVFFSRFLTACAHDVNENSLKDYALSKILFFRERSPVHYTANWDRTHELPEIGLYMNHSLEEKRKMLTEKGLNIGKYSEMLKRGDMLEPYN